MADPIKIVVNASNPAKIVVNQGPITIQGGSNYTLPAATNSTLGGVIVPDGGGLAIDSGGNLTVTGGGGLPPNVTTGNISYLSTTGSVSTLSGWQANGDSLGQPRVGLSGYTSAGAFVAESYGGADAATSNDYAILQVTSTSINLTSETKDQTREIGLKTSTAAAGLQLLNKNSGVIGGLTARPVGDSVISGTAMQSYLYSGTGAENTADSVKLTVNANATNYVAEIVPGANLTPIYSGNSVLTQSYADTRYIASLDKAGTIIDYFADTTIFGTANATNAMATGDFIYDDGGGTYSKNTGALWVGSSYEQAFSGVFQPSAISQPRPKMSLFDGGSDVSLELLAVPPDGTTVSVGIEAKVGGSLYYEAQNACCILTRGYADTRYIKNGSQYGNLTVTDSVAFAGGIQAQLSAPNFGEKIIHYVLSGGVRTDWLANSTTPGLESYLYGASVIGSPGGASLQKTSYNTYPSNGTYTQIFLSDTDATLALGKIGSGIVKTKTWGPNSILTQGYADTRYLTGLDKTGTSFDFYNSVKAIGAGSATDSVAVGRFIFNDGMNYTDIIGAYRYDSTNTVIGTVGLVKESALLDYNVKCTIFNGNDEYGLILRPSQPPSVTLKGGLRETVEFVSGNVGIRCDTTQDITAKDGTDNAFQAKSNASILTRGYADTRYAAKPATVFTGTFTTQDGKTVVVENGVIKSVV